MNDAKMFNCKTQKNIAMGINHLHVDERDQLQLQSHKLRKNPITKCGSKLLCKMQIKVGKKNPKMYQAIKLINSI